MNNQPHPAGHVLVPSAAIGALSVLLAAGLGALGMLDGLNLMISTLVTHGKAVQFPKSLPDGWIWLATVIFGFGMSFVILSVARPWRRWVLWITAMVLIGGWAPVLSLAAHAPAIAAPLVAVLWSGVCALVYAHKHRMACDEIAESSPSENSHEAR